MAEKKVLSTSELMGEAPPTTKPKAVVTTSELFGDSSQAESSKGVYERFAERALPVVKETEKFLVDAVGTTSEFIDKWNPFGAPAREAIKEAQKFDGNRNVGGAYLAGFGKEDAASGKDIAKGFGIPDDKQFSLPIITNPFSGEKLTATPAGLVGGVIETGLDPTLYLGSGPLLKAAKTGSTALKAEKAGQRMINFAEERAAKAGLGNSFKAFKEAGKMGPKGKTVENVMSNIRELGRTLIDDGALGRAKNTEEIAQIAAKNKETYGQIIGELGTIVDTALDAKSIDSADIAKDLRSYAADLPKVGKGKVIRERILEEAENFDQLGKVGFGDAISLKAQFQYNPQAADLLVTDKDATNAINRIVAKRIEESVNKVKGFDWIPHEVKDMLGNYKQFNKKYGQYATVADAGAERAVKDVSNRFFSPSDQGFMLATGVADWAAGGGADVSTLLMGASAGVANKIMRERGPAFVANVADNLGKFLKSNADGLNKWVPELQTAAGSGNAALVLQHNTLMNNDPKYRQAVISGLTTEQLSDGAKTAKNALDAVGLSQIAMGGIAVPMLLMKKGGSLTKAAKEMLRLNDGENIDDVRSAFVAQAKKADPAADPQDLSQIFDKTAVKSAGKRKPLYEAHEFNPKTNSYKTVTKEVPVASKIDNDAMNNNRWWNYDKADEETKSLIVKLEGEGHPEPYIGRGTTRYTANEHKGVGDADQFAISNIKPDGKIGRDVPNGGADPFSWLDTKYQAGKEALKLHAGKELKINTRSDLIAHDDYLSLLDPKKHEVNFFVANANERASRAISGSVPSLNRVIKAAQKLKDAGIKVTIHFEEVPGLKKEYQMLLEHSADGGVFSIKKFDDPNIQKALKGIAVTHHKSPPPTKETLERVKGLIGDDAFENPLGFKIPGR